MVAAQFYFDDNQVIRVRSLDALPWVEHGFGTRLSRNWPPQPALTVKQIHSNRVLPANGRKSGVIGEGDALIVSQAGTLAAIRTADCLPILLADPVRRVVAAVHAGWRGTVAGISSLAVEELSNKFGSRSSDLIAVIGPGIGECCFEVGPEVASQFVGLFPERDNLQERTRISLVEANRRQLREAGVQADRIEDIQECTCCGREQFESFRRDREASGRMVAAIGIKS